jgi:uncharacterized protein YecE (DUF72 family)
MSQIRIGISGWRYEPWRKKFYPPKLTQKNELWYASRCLNSIELNGSFYSLQRPSSYRAWYEQTPDDFVFTMKGGQFITHIRRLREIEQPLANFFASGLLLLKEKLGPILWQFPPNFQYDHERFEQFFKILPRNTEQAVELSNKRAKTMKGEKVWIKPDACRPIRHAIEFRHESFVNKQFVDLARREKIGVVVADTTRRFPYIEDITADFVYIRLHGDEELYASGYSDEALDRWAERIRIWKAGKEPPDARRARPRSKPAKGGRDIYVYFDNDIKVRSPFDAMSLSRRLGIELTPPKNPAP